MHYDNLIHEITVLMKSQYHFVHLQTLDEERSLTLLTQVSQSLNLPLMIWSIHTGLIHAENSSKITNTDTILKLIKHIHHAEEECVYFIRSCELFLKDVSIQAQFIGLLDRLKKDYTTIFFAANVIQLGNSFLQHIASVKLPLPTSEDYLNLLKQTYNDLNNETEIKLAVSQKEIDQIVYNLKGIPLFEAKKIITMFLVEDKALTKEDVSFVLTSKRKLIEKEGILEYYSAKESMIEIADMKSLKSWLRKRKKFIENPKMAKEIGLTFPKGILLLGIPGTGKSLSAKAISTEWNLPLLRMDPAKLYSKYIGETEEKFDRAMKISEKMSPLILWIDEIEKAFAGNSEADGGVSQRVIGSFLSWMQEREGDVFVVATANDVNKLPPEFLRKGRFDEIFFIDLPDTSTREEIFQIHFRRRKLSLERIDFRKLALKTEGFSGAEIEQVIVEALYSVFSKETKLSQLDIEKEIQKTRPLSVLFSEKISALRKWAKERTVSAN